MMSLNDITIDSYRELCSLEYFSDLIQKHFENKGRVIFLTANLLLCKQHLTNRCRIVLGGKERK